MRSGPAARVLFPPKVEAAVKKIACQLPAEHEEPLSRLFIPDIKRLVVAEKIVSSISESTIWRILDADALKPWRRHSWIWSPDPLFAERAGPVLDLYQGLWKGRELGPDDFVLSADEKTGIQARRRLHAPEVHGDGRGQRVEHEYERKGAWAYIAAYDVHRAKIKGRLEKTTGKAPFDRLVEQVMTTEPYASAKRVFWIVDQGSSHRPGTFPSRLQSRYPNAIAVMLPVHASWLNQIEIYFSILERKALTPNDFATLKDVRERILGFQRLYGKTASPFNWTYTRRDMQRHLREIPKILTMPPQVKKTG